MDTHMLKDLAEVQSFKYYYASLSRQMAERFLAGQKLGTFLLRNSSRKGMLVISLAQTSKVVHLLVIRGAHHWSMDPSAWQDRPLATATFRKLSDLIQRLQADRILGAPLQDLQNAEASIGAVGRQEMKDALEGKRSHSQNSSQNHSDSYNNNNSAKEGEERKLVDEYTGMLKGLMIDRHLSASEVAGLRDWREEHGFSEELHDKIVASLGIEHLFTQVEQEADDSADLCVCCLASPKQAAFIPCGHLATCKNCAALMSICPICRVPVTRFLKVWL